MGPDAPSVPEVPVPGATPPGPEPMVPEELESLSEIVEAVQEAPPKPEPIFLDLFLPPSPKKPNGSWKRIKVVTRFPPDQWKFGIAYMTEVMPKQRSLEPNEKKEMVQTHPNWDVVALAREVVISPVWLHNEKAVDELHKTIGSTLFSTLRRRLMLAAGLDGDFFAEYRALTTPMAIYSSIVSGSPKGSGNPPGLSTESPPNGSSPGSSTTGSAAPKTAESASGMTSGSLPSTPTTAPPA